MTNTKLEILLDKIARTLLYYSPFRHFVLYKYRYAFSPLQYCKLIEIANKASEVEGDFIEVGCYRGYTTVILNKHIDDLGHKRRYYAVDTFGGFTSSSVEHEINKRNKKSTKDKRSFNKFTVNAKKWFDMTMKLNSITRVITIKENAENLDHVIDSIDKLCFAFIDVDLYQPTLLALNSVYGKMNWGGHIVVDDCAENHTYDGSRQALEDFCNSKNLSFEIAREKLGVVKIGLQPV